MPHKTLSDGEDIPSINGFFLVNWPKHNRTDPKLAIKLLNSKNLHLHRGHSDKHKKKKCFFPKIR